MENETRFRKNLQLIIAVSAVAGVVVGVINFFTAFAVAPLAQEVRAQQIRIESLEKTREDDGPVLVTVKTKVEVIYDDIKAIKNYLKIL